MPEDGVISDDGEDSRPTSAELYLLTEFLRTCPGRISAALVNGSGGSDRLLKQLRERLPDFPFIITRPDHHPAIMVRERLALPEEHESIFIIPLDGRRIFASDKEARDFYEALNFQREPLAGGRHRTLFLLDQENDRWLTIVADDLRSWIREYDFTAEGVALRQSMFSSEQIHDRESSPVSDEYLASLVRQAEEAKKTGLPPLVVADQYLIPMIEAALSRSALGVARRGTADLQSSLQHSHSEKSEEVQLLNWQASTLLGDIYRMEGDVSGALEAYRVALRLAEAISRPESADSQRDLSVSYERVGDMEAAKGNVSEAVALYHKGLAIRARLAASDPSHAGWRRDLSISYDRIGDMEVAQGNIGGALAAYRKGLAVRERLAASDPSNRDWQRDLSISQSKIGYMEATLGTIPEALSAYRKGLSIAEGLAASDPSNASWQRDLAISHQQVGDMQTSQGSTAEALASYRKGLAIAERLAMSDPSNSDWQRDVALSHLKLAYVHEQSGNTVEALTHWKRSLCTFEKMIERGMHLSPHDVAGVEWLQQKVAGA